MKILHFSKSTDLFLAKLIHRSMMVVYSHDSTPMNRLSVLFLCLSLFFSFTPSTHSKEFYKEDITRAEAVKIAIDNEVHNFLREKFQNYQNEENCFDDLNDWQRKYICFALKKGILEKRENQTSFFPNQIPTTAEGLKIAYLTNSYFPRCKKEFHHWSDRFICNEFENLNKDELMTFEKFNNLLTELYNEKLTTYNKYFFNINELTDNSSQYYDVDILTFQYFSSDVELRHFIDNSTFYYDAFMYIVPISDIDTPSFEMLNSHFFKDKNNVYSKINSTEVTGMPFTLIENVDIPTFNIYNENYSSFEDYLAYDKNTSYYFSHPLGVRFLPNDTQQLSETCFQSKNQFYQLNLKKVANYLYLNLDKPISKIENCN